MSCEQPKSNPVLIHRSFFPPVPGIGSQGRQGRPRAPPGCGSTGNKKENSKIPGDLGEQLKYDWQKIAVILDCRESLPRHRLNVGRIAARVVISLKILTRSD
jgi:hypothetical protein